MSLEKKGELLKRDLFRLARHIDPLPSYISKEAEHHLTWGLFTATIEIALEYKDEPQAKTLQESGAAAHRSNGKKKDIIAAYNRLNGRAPRERAGIIAKQLGVHPKYVQRVIREARPGFKKKNQSGKSISDRFLPSAMPFRRRKRTWKWTILISPPKSAWTP